MIKVTSPSSGREVFIAPSNIMRISEASPACTQYGIRAYIRTVDGQTIEARETASSLAAQVQLHQPQQDDWK